jgi:Holliday junction resolvase
VVCLEVKTSGGRPVYVTKDEANDLVDFASDFGAEAYIAVRFKSRSLRDTTVYCSPINMMHETEKSYRAKYEDCVEKPHWKPLSVICE